MTEKTVRYISAIPPHPLPALETIESLQIRPVPQATLFSIANRLLRFDFPPQRDYDLSIKLLNKALISPRFSFQQLQGLPIRTIETLAQSAFYVALGSPPFHHTPAPLDWLLNAIVVLEETCQFTLSTMISEDLALLEGHQAGELHGFFYKPNQNPEHLAELLSHEGFRVDFLQTSRTESDVDLCYWLCRRLTFGLPWSLLLQRFDETPDPAFPYLARFAEIRRFLLTQDVPSQPPEALAFMATWIPRILGWIQNEFRQFSAMAGTPRPVEELVLAEGSTEALLIPAIARTMGYDLNAEGLLIQPVGGKNQMLQQYVHYLERLNVPISIVMDRDALPLLPDLNFYRRDPDRMFILEEGEFEDLYSPELIVKTLNTAYRPDQPVTLAGLRQMRMESQVSTLQRIWPQLGLGLFDKVEFAQKLSEILAKEPLLSPPMRQLVQQLLETKGGPHEAPSA